MPPLVHLLLVALLGLPASSTPMADTWWQPQPGLSWQWQLERSKVDPILPIDVYNLDGLDASRESIDSLRELDIRTICYLNVGAWEEWRDDADTFPAKILGSAYPGWDGERFIDIRQMDVLAPIMEARLDACAAKGFDAVEPDNMDVWLADSGFPLTREDGLRYARWLTDAAHERGLAIAQKNTPELVPELVHLLDLAITEDCAADGWCDSMRPYIDAGKPVLAAEYTDRIDGTQFEAYCADESLASFSLILKRRELDAWRMGCEESASKARAPQSMAYRLRPSAQTSERIPVNEEA